MKIPKLKEPQKVLHTFSEAQIKTLLSFKPRNFNEARAWTTALFIADCGMRIDEVMNLRPEEIDFDNMLVEVKRGKGGKGRVVPITLEMRGLLYKYSKKYPLPGPVFGTRKGIKACQQNLLKIFQEICRKLGITGPRLSWHTLRHSMATTYIQSGGDVFRLQQILGHSNIATTRKYVHLAAKDLADVHHKHSLLAAAAK